MSVGEKYFKLFGFADPVLGYPSFLTPVFSNTGSIQSGELFTALTDNAGRIEQFHSFRQESIGSITIRVASQRPTLITSVGDTGVYAFAINEQDVLYERGFRQLCQRSLTDAYDALLNHNPLLGLAIAEYLDDTKRQLEFVLNAAIQIKKLDAQV